VPPYPCQGCGGVIVTLRPCLACIARANFSP